MQLKAIFFFLWTKRVVYVYNIIASSKVPRWNYQRIVFADVYPVSNERSRFHSGTVFIHSTDCLRHHAGDIRHRKPLNPLPTFRIARSKTVRSELIVRAMLLLMKRDGGARISLTQRNTQTGRARSHRWRRA